jgi:peptidyl-prolyl cis-trans isomerase D
MLQIDRVKESALQPLAEVRDRVVAAWKSEQRRKAAQTRALELVDRIEGGTPIGEVASAEGLATTMAKPVNRLGQGDESGAISPILVSDMFRIRVGQAAFSEAPDSFTVAQLKEIVPADPAAAGELAKLLSNNLMSDILIQFNTGLRQRFGVEIDRAVIARLN